MKDACTTLQMTAITIMSTSKYDQTTVVTPMTYCAIKGSWMIIFAKKKGTAKLVLGLRYQRIRITQNMIEGFANGKKVWRPLIEGIFYMITPLKIFFYKKTHTSHKTKNKQQIGFLRTFRGLMIYFSVDHCGEISDEKNVVAL